MPLPSDKLSAWLHGCAAQCRPTGLCQYCAQLALYNPTGTAVWTVPTARLGAVVHKLEGCAEASGCTFDGLKAFLAVPAASSHPQNKLEASQRQTDLVIAALRGIVPQANYEAAARAAHEVASLRLCPAVILGRAVLGIHHRQERCVGRVPEGCIWGVGQQMGGVPAGQRIGGKLDRAPLSADLHAGHGAGRAAAAVATALEGEAACRCLQPTGTGEGACEWTASGLRWHRELQASSVGSTGCPLQGITLSLKGSAYVESIRHNRPGEQASMSSLQHVRGPQHPACLPCSAKSQLPSKGREQSMYLNV